MRVSVEEIVQNIVGKVADRLADKLPLSSMSDDDRLKLRLEAEMLASSECKAAMACVKDAHELAGQDDGGATAPSVWALSAIHRPIWSFLILGVFIWTIFAPYAGYPEVSLSTIHKDIIQTVLIIYFAGRSIEKVAALAWGR